MDIRDLRRVESERVGQRNVLGLLNNAKSEFEAESHELVGAEVCFIVIFSPWATWTHAQIKQIGGSSRNRILPERFHKRKGERKLQY